MINGSGTGHGAGGSFQEKARWQQVWFRFRAIFEFYVIWRGNANGSALKTVLRATPA
jgi:hypothetical protein